MVEVKQTQLIYENLRYGQLIVSVEWSELDGRPSRRIVFDALRQFYAEYKDQD